ncbi:Zinc finger MYM-type protein 1 [Linum perenne]
MKQAQSIGVALFKQSDQAKKDYRIRLEASIDCVTWLLHNGLALRGHDESESSTSKGNFLELLQFHVRGRDHIESVVLKNAPKNLLMTSPDVQRDIVNAIATETTKAIINDIGDDLFTILVDEARDVSVKEQMAIVLRYVNKEGSIVERFLGISHVKDTKALTLKKEIEYMLVTHGLSLSRIRGQGYDGASNMKGEINGLKTLILAENSAAYYVHCFAHQLQLTLVAVAKSHGDVSGFFTMLSSLIKLVGSSCKRRDNIRDSQATKVAEALCHGELETGRGLNQEIGLKRPSDTRWGSHFRTLIGLPIIFSSLIEVLGVIEDEGGDSGEANIMLKLIQNFEFAFILKMMTRVLTITNELSIALQRKDQDIVNAMRLVHVAKLRLQEMRDNGWEPLLDDVLSFCNKESIPVSNMDDLYFPHNKGRQKAQPITNLHRFKVDLFYTVVDMQLQELNNRFDEVSTELLCCVACLNPDDLFIAFDKQKFVKLATFYPEDFSIHDISFFGFQLETYVHEMKLDERFKGLKGIAELSRRMVETGKHFMYPKVYLLIRLAILLPVATASVERAFSAMSYIKNKLRNRIRDELLNDCLVVYIEKNVASSLEKECIVQYFQNMKTRRGVL